jgi:ComEC/Rec2-related protein
LTRPWRWRAGVCLAVFTVLCGYYGMGEGWGRRLVILAVFLGIGGLTLELGLRFASGCKRSGQVRRLWLCLACAVLGLAYGMWREWYAPAWLDSWVGFPVQIEGTVTEIQTIGSSTYVKLHATAITSVVAGGGWQHCDAPVEWRFGTGDGVVRIPVSGSRVLLQGTLVAPSPSQAASGLMLQPSKYPFRGRALTVQTVSSGWPDRMRMQIERGLQHGGGLSEADIALLESVVFGTGPVGEAVTDQFLRAGLLHVLAASGANVMLLLTVVASLIRPLQRLTRLRVPFLGLLLVFLWVFMCLCDCQPSIVRATLMAAYRMVGSACGRSAHLVNGMLLAALAMALWQPQTLLGVSAWLSFAATAAIQYALANRPRRPFGSRQRRLLAQVADRDEGWRGSRLVYWGRRGLSTALRHGGNAVWLCLTIEAWLSPLTLLLFHQVTPYSVLTNVLAEPLLVLLLPLAAGAAVSAALAAHLPALNPLVWLLLQVTLPVLHCLTNLAAWVANRPGSLHQVATVDPLGVAAWYLVLMTLPAAVSWARTRRIRTVVPHLDG